MEVTRICCCLALTLSAPAKGESLGWQKYFAENPTEFHDLPLEWEPGSRVPDWLTGIYVRNGPAQISFGSNRY
jgi:carotenoid cleavage dioxygenase-like enzyme